MFKKWVKRTGVLVADSAKLDMLKSIYTSLLIVQVTLISAWQQLTTAVSRHTQDVWWIIHLLAVWWPGAQSARDDHLFAYNFDNYSPI